MGDTEPRARSYVRLLQEEDKVTLKNNTGSQNIIYNNLRIYDSPISNMLQPIQLGDFPYTQVTIISLL